MFDAFSLSRDTTGIVYQIEKSVSDDVYTNKDVILKIISNKKIGPIEGFELDKTQTILTKNISQNENNTVILEDLSGNKKEVNYSITNIDKEPPQIIGVEDGITYNKTLQLQYIDNIGVKDIKVDYYNNDLKIRCVEDYYDTGEYKGLDILGNKIYVSVRERPKGTKYYNYYINNVLKASTEKSEYTYTGLTNATTYTIRVDAMNKDDNVIKSSSMNIKTKCFTGITTEKNGNNFKVKISGIDNRVSLGYCALWHQGTTTQKFITPFINSDRSVDLSFNAYDVDGTKNSGYYYFHLQLFSNENPNLNEVICMNIKFDGITYVKTDPFVVNKNNFQRNGYYEIFVTDLAGNQTNKNCTILR